MICLLQLIKPEVLWRAVDQYWLATGLKIYFLRNTILDSSVDKV